MSRAKGSRSSPSSSLCPCLLRALAQSPQGTMLTPGLHSPRRSPCCLRSPC